MAFRARMNIFKSGISWPGTARGANKDGGFGQFVGPADGGTMAMLPVCTITLFGKEGA